MNVRLQTRNENTNQVMGKAMDRVNEIGDILSNKFKKALEVYDSKH
jgi:hypothetical protein